jgi:hypothetical protein
VGQDEQPESLSDNQIPNYDLELKLIWDDIEQVI